MEALSLLNVYQYFRRRISLGKHERNRPIERPRCWWVDNFKTNLGKTGWGGMDWIDMAQDRDLWTATVNMRMNLRDPMLRTGTKSAILHATLPCINMKSSLSFISIN
jgi:hypothetical protein